ncbi:MAG: succinate dehydrogenase, cytochrome b556 subunit [Proteobacteria bacterium]|nr:MAG: succinate dehydrogenase, cytochrome b556 subunit [Pseudomonadota bacterium]
MKQNHRPIYLDIPKLGSRMSITAKISILHRVSGVLMFLAIPLVLFLLHKTLTDQTFYNQSCAILGLPVMKLIYLVLIWAVMHHVCAGIRFLFLDIEMGLERATAQKTARLVLVVSLVLTAIMGVLIW